MVALVCCVPAICSSSLPVQGASGAGNVPLTQFPLQVSLLEVGLLFHSIGSVHQQTQPPAFQNRPQLLTNWTLRLQFKHTPRQQTDRVQPPQTKHRHKGVLCGRVLHRLISSRVSAPHHPGPLCLGRQGNLLALGIHGVHCHGGLKVVAVMEGRVLGTVMVELVTQEGCSLRWGIQVQVLVMVTYVHPR